MSRLSVLLLAAGFTAIGAAQALAQQQAQQERCREGRMASGECVDVELGASARKSAVVYAIPKLSYTSPPYLPSQDRSFYGLRDHHEITNLFGQPPISANSSNFIITRP